MLLIVLATSLLCLLLLALGACQPVTQPNLPPPHRLAVIPVIQPRQIVVNPGGYAYAFLDDFTGGAIAVLDGPRLVTIIPWPEVTRSRAVKDAQIAIHPTTGQLYVAETAGYLHVISGTQVITSVPGIGYRPKAITIHPDNHLVYIANVLPKNWTLEDRVNGPSSVTILSDTQVITKLDIGYAPQVIVVNPVDGRVYVGQNTGYSGWQQEVVGMLGIIEDTQLVTNTSLGPIIETFTLADIAVNVRNGDMYMLQNLYPVLYWDRVHAPISVTLDFSNQGEGGGGLNQLAVDSQHNLAYVGYWGPTSMVAVMRQGQVFAQIPVGEDPRQIAVDAVRNYVYVTNRLAGTLSVLRETEAVATLETGGFGAMFLAVDETRGYVYVSNSDTDSITVFGYE